MYPFMPAQKVVGYGLVNVQMLEPVSAAIGCYIISKMHKMLDKRICKRGPMWLRRNKFELASASMDEISEMVVNQINYMCHHLTSMDLACVCVMYAVLLLVAIS